jgi:hypothetical protein
MSLHSVLRATSHAGEHVAAARQSLNPRLYTAMCRKFGGVEVLNPGQRMEARYVQSETGRTVLEIDTRGETYKSSCPFCGDSRGRLWVNHMYGVRDVRLDRTLSELWKCYNAECQDDAENRITLRRWLIDDQGSSVIPASSVSVVPSTGPKPLPAIEFPGRLVPLTDREAVPGMQYLKGKRYDPEELVALWRVGFAAHVPIRTREALVQNRIVIPVYQSGVMVGYQARFTDDVDWRKTGIRKYLTYFPKSKAVYGADEAAACDPIVVCEGAPDVWRYGHGAVALFGKSASPDQVRILAHLCNGKRIVYVPDNNSKVVGSEDESTEAFILTATRVRDRQTADGIRPSAVGMYLPARGHDAGSTDRSVLRAGVARAAAEAA